MTRTLWSISPNIPTQLHPAPLMLPRPDPAGPWTLPTTTIMTLQERRRLWSTAACDRELNHTAYLFLPRPLMTQPVISWRRDICHCVAPESIRWRQLNNFHRQTVNMKNSPLQPQTRPASVHQGASGLTVVFRSPKDPETLQLSGAG